MLFTTSVPPFRYTSPVNVLLPESTKIPAPDFTKGLTFVPLAAMTLLMVSMSFTPSVRITRSVLPPTGAVSVPPLTVAPPAAFPVFRMPLSVRVVAAV